MPQDDFSPGDLQARTQAEAHVRCLVQRKRDDRPADHLQASAATVGSVGIVGAGMMGTAIAAACLRHGLPVVITDNAPEAIRHAAQQITGELVASGEDAATAEALVRKSALVTDDPTRAAECDLVLESIVESAAAKHEIYRRLETHLGPQAILASNTSTIPIRRLATAVAAPQRFCGIHFFHPVRQRPLVEIIRGPQSAEETIVGAAALASRIEKIPIVVDDGPGFLVNRLLLPYLNEALELLLDGASAERIEQEARGFGMAKGPLELMDEIGLDTTLLGGRVLWDAFPDRVIASPLLVSMVKAGLVGRKAGQGFFAYPDVVPRKPVRKSFEELLASWQRTNQPPPRSSVASRLFLPMVLEAAWMFQEGAVRDPRDVDLAVLFGLGFPSSRGGLLYWADTLGAARILELLEPLRSLGARMAPPRLLEEMAREGRGFYAQAD